MEIVDLAALAEDLKQQAGPKLGYVVTGVMPDANGRGRPDIYLSKAL